MGRTAAILFLCASALGPLPGCGDVAADAEAPTLLEAPALSEAEARSGASSSGPILAGRGRARTERVFGSAANAPKGPRATVDADGAITIPAGATWGAVQVALQRSAHLRREREHLPEMAEMLVPLPGVEGYVIVDGSRRRGSTGLDLRIQAPPGGVQVEAVGTAWIAQHGCEAELSWQGDGWSLAPWRAALTRLSELGKASEHGLRIEADSSVPASEVMPFVAAATQAGFGAVHIRPSGRRRFYDAVEGSGSWLASHQAPTGAWDDDVALGLCDGHRMRGVPLYADPDTVANAGQTGLCLLAFLGAGYTNRGKHAFARVISRGLRHLKNVQRPDGVFQGAAAWDDAVSHGFAALAMVEAYGMTGSPIFKGSAQRGLDALAAVWWAAGEDPLATALTGMTLRSAQLVNTDCVKRGKQAPLKVSEKLVGEVLEEARGYDLEAGDLRAICGLFLRILFEGDTRKSTEVMAGALRVAEVFEKAGASLDPTCTWLGTLVCYQVGHEPWKRVVKALKTCVIDRQRKDGHYCCFNGSWDPRPRPSLPGGRVSATAACALSLQVFYRYDRVFGAR